VKYKQGAYSLVGNVNICGVELVVRLTHPIFFELVNPPGPWRLPETTLMRTQSHDRSKIYTPFKFKLMNTWRPVIRYCPKMSKSRCQEDAPQEALPQQ
jgi:hypothetical protein